MIQNFCFFTWLYVGVRNALLRYCGLGGGLFGLRVRFPPRYQNLSRRGKMATASFVHTSIRSTSRATDLSSLWSSRAMRVIFQALFLVRMFFPLFFFTSFQSCLWRFPSFSRLLSYPRSHCIGYTFFAALRCTWLVYLYRSLVATRRACI